MKQQEAIWVAILKEIVKNEVKNNNKIKNKQVHADEWIVSQLHGIEKLSQTLITQSSLLTW